jgi:carbonic anhydrase/acetyltransferase-like protein (isoleucine patch superfamily)
MAIYRFMDFTPTLGQGVYIAESADVIGNVKLGSHCSLWFNVVARGDVNQIVIGENTNIQDLSMLHVTEQNDLIIGSNVSVGHSVTLHGCHIGNSCLIGMNSVILDGAVISDFSLVAAGSLVTPNKKFPPGVMIKGRPAVVERELTEEEKQKFGNHYQSYKNYKDQFLNHCEKINF